MSDELDARKDEYRLAKIEDIERELDSEVQKYGRTLKIYKRIGKVVSVTLGICSTLNIIYTTGTISTAATGIGAIACIPLSSLTVINSIGLLVLTILSKHIGKKKKKHENTVRLARTYKSQVEDDISKALNDGDINETEYTTVVTSLKNYYDEKEQLRQPSTTFSEDLTAHAP